jgi:hypothetical protein
MGAKKVRDVEVLDFREKRMKNKVTAFKQHKISQKKIDKLEALELKYKNQKKVVQDGPDY